MSSPSRSFDEMFEHATPLKPLFYKRKCKFQRAKGSTRMVYSAPIGVSRKTGLQAGKTTAPFKALDFAKRPQRTSGAGGGTRTRTGQALAILSRLCLPFHHARTTRPDASTAQDGD